MVVVVVVVHMAIVIIITNIIIILVVRLNIVKAHSFIFQTANMIVRRFKQIILIKHDVRPTMTQHIIQLLNVFHGQPKRRDLGQFLIRAGRRFTVQRKWNEFTQILEGTVDLTHARSLTRVCRFPAIFAERCCLGFRFLFRRFRSGHRGVGCGGFRWSFGGWAGGFAWTFVG